MNSGYLSTRKSSRKMGIWSSMGRQPPRGLTPNCLKSAICSRVIFSRSSLYLAWSSLILGWSCCMAFMDLMLLKVRGRITILKMIVRIIMLQPWLPVTWSVRKFREPTMKAEDDSTIWRHIITKPSTVRLWMRQGTGS